MSFEATHHFPRGGEDLVAPEPASPRRQVVEEARASRCEALRTELETIAPAFSGRPRRVLEIGCGHGHFLEAYAAAHPQQFCIGIDYCAERARRALRKQGRNTHGNLHFMRAEVWEFLDSLPSTFRFDTIFVLFPDPWPKRRHSKYRLISERFLERMVRFAQPETKLCLRTDAEAYFAEAMETISGHPAWRIDPSVPWPFEQPTVFQVKAPAFQSLVAVNANSAR